MFDAKDGEEDEYLTKARRKLSLLPSDWISMTLPLWLIIWFLSWAVFWNIPFLGFCTINFLQKIIMVYIFPLCAISHPSNLTRFIVIIWIIIYRLGSAVKNPSFGT